MTDIRLIAIDLDGTLLRGKGSDPIISDYTVEVLRKAVAKGAYVAISSGRIYNDAMGYSEMIAPNQPIICSNGSMACTHDPFTVVYCECMPKPVLRSVVEILEKDKCYYQVYCDDGAVMESRHPSPFVSKKSDVYDYTGDVLTGDEMPKYVGDGALKVVCFDNDFEKLAKVRAKLEKLDNIEINSSWAGNVELLAKGVNKAASLRALAEHLGVPMESTMALGDNENDLSMIEAAGIGVAMGNATDLVKAKADYITATNMEDGVAKAVAKFVLGEE